MKKLIVPIIICVVVFGSMFSCRKVENPRLGPLTNVPLLNLTDSSGTAYIKPFNLIDTGSFTRSFTIDMYYKNDTKPASVDIVVVKNGVGANYSDTSMKIFKTGITTFPAVITFTSADLINMFGPLALSDTFEFGVNINMQNGMTQPAFITGTDSIKGGPSYGAAVSSPTPGNGLPGEHYELTYVTPQPPPPVCAFDPSVFVGSYFIVEDDWADYAVGDPVPNVTPGPGRNQLTLTVYPSTAFGSNRKTMLVTIDTVNIGAGNASVANQIIGDYDGAPPGATIQTNADTTKSMVDFCHGEIILDLDFNIGGSNYRGNTLDIKKRE